MMVHRDLSMALYPRFLELEWASTERDAVWSSGLPSRGAEKPVKRHGRAIHPSHDGLVARDAHLIMGAKGFARVKCNESIQ
jgi:hypothetical protein